MPTSRPAVVKWGFRLQQKGLTCSVEAGKVLCVPYCIHSSIIHLWTCFTPALKQCHTFIPTVIPEGKWGPIMHFLFNHNLQYVENFILAVVYHILYFYNSVHRKQQLQIPGFCTQSQSKKPFDVILYSHFWVYHLKVDWNIKNHCKHSSIDFDVNACFALSHFQQKTQIVQMTSFPRLLPAMRIPVNKLSQHIHTVSCLQLAFTDSETKPTRWLIITHVTHSVTWIQHTKCPTKNTGHVPSDC